MYSSIYTHTHRTHIGNVIPKSMGQINYIPTIPSVRTLEWTLGMNHLGSSTSFAAQKSRHREERDYTLDKSLKFLSNSDPLIHCRKVKCCEDGKEKGDRGRKLSQHTHSSSTPEQVMLPLS